MSPTLLELTLALVAAVLVFLLALQLIPLVIERLARYFDQTLGDQQQTKEHIHDTDQFKDDNV
jgi:lipopolysaccharide export LptBFGC system permease protein LptF